jgi:hypothetical protein
MVGLWNYSQSVYICEICGLFSSVSVAKDEIATLPLVARNDKRVVYAAGNNGAVGRSFIVIARRRRKPTTWQSHRMGLLRTARNDKAGERTRNDG